MGFVRARGAEGLLLLVLACRPDGASPPDAGATAVDAGSSSAGLSSQAVLAAHDALQGGSTDVALSLDGRVRLRRVMQGAQVVQAEILVDGERVMQRTHDATGWTAVWDQDRDGVPERRMTMTRDAETGGRTTVVEEVPGPHGLRRRETTRRLDESLEIVWEWMEADGSFSTVLDWTTTLWQPAGIEGPLGGGECTAEQAEQIHAATEEALQRGMSCFEELGMYDVAQFFASQAAERGITLACEDLEANYGLADGCALNVSADPAEDQRISISVDDRAFTDPRCGDLLPLLLHELLHSSLGGHNPFAHSIEREHRSEYDRVNACTRICTDRSSATRCDCAQCLGTDPCDPRCAEYNPCGRGGIFYCTCVDQNYTFPTLEACESGCPATIGCFARRCVKFPSCQ
ncbi:MAG: hypothetical protein AB2A00_31440 [Myxococcota bacterium]